MGVEMTDGLYGWIQPCDSDDVDACRAELEALGVEIGSWDSDAKEFYDCVVSDAVMDKLDTLWGRYIWGLQ